MKMVTKLWLQREQPIPHSDLEVATEKFNAALSEYEFVADWDDQICDGERRYRSKVNEARTLKESVMASVYEARMRDIKNRKDTV